MAYKFEVTIAPVDTVLSELLALETEVKAKYKRIEEIKAWCKAQGSFCTSLYVCSIKTHTRVGLVGLEKAAKVISKDKLQELGMIQVSEFKTVHVSRKGPDDIK